MRVQLRFIRKAAELQETLENDGWKLEWATDKSLSARHPQVPDERAARSRLHQLGLLTSSSLGIEFNEIRIEHQMPRVN